MRRPERFLIAFGCACAAAVIGYALIRVAERSLFPEPNPAVVIWSERSGYVWRIALSLYIGGMGGFGGYALALRSLETAARWLARGALLAALLIAAQGALAP